MSASQYQDTETFHIKPPQKPIKWKFPFLPCYRAIFGLRAVVGAHEIGIAHKKGPLRGIPPMSHIIRYTFRDCYFIKNKRFREIILEPFERQMHRNRRDYC